MLPRTAVNDASDYDSEIEKVKARNLQKPHPNSIARSTQRDEHQGVTNLSNRLENLTFMASQFLPETG